jgi:hypothetical protein
MSKRFFGIVLFILFIVVGLGISSVSAETIIGVNYNNELGNDNHFISANTFNNLVYGDEVAQAFIDQGVIEFQTFNEAPIYKLLVGPGDYRVQVNGGFYILRIYNNI